MPMYTPDNASAPGVALVHTLGGEPVQATKLQNASIETAEPATRHMSTAPYKPTRKAHMCEAKNNTCLGRRMKDQPYCVGHMRSFGLLKNDKNAAKHPKDPS